jgi:hypothetical protein
MVRYVMLCLAVACDSGATKPATAPPPVPVQTPPPADASAPVDAGAIVDAEVVDAMQLAPPKAAAAQKRDCAKAATKIGSVLGGDKREKTETDAATRKACIDGPWSATVIDCAIHAKGDENPYDCTLMLPRDQEKAWHKATKEVFCKYNDCIPDDMTPRPPLQGGSDDGIPID